MIILSSPKIVVHMQYVFLTLLFLPHDYFVHSSLFILGHLANELNATVSAVENLISWLSAYVCVFPCVYQCEDTNDVISACLRVVVSLCFHTRKKSFS